MKRGRAAIVSDDQIREMHKRIMEGETVKSVISEFGISRQAFYDRINKLGLEYKAKKRVDKLKNIKIDDIVEITNMYQLAALLNLSYEDVHMLVDPDKSLSTNVSRMSYLRHNSPEKFQEVIVNLIVKHFKLTPLELIRVLKNI